MLLTSELNKPQMQETPRSESLALPRGANTFSLAILQCSGTWLGTLRPITPAQAYARDSPKMQSLSVTSLPWGGGQPQA